MEHLLLVLIGLFLGVSLGMATMALLAAADRDQLPEPAPGDPRASRASGLEGREPSWAGVGVRRTAGSGASLVESPLGASTPRARDSA